MRMVSTQSTSSSTGATWSEALSKCVLGSLDRQGTRPWCPHMEQDLRGAPQVTSYLYLSSLTEPASGTEPGVSLQALSVLAPGTLGQGALGGSQTSFLFVVFKLSFFDCAPECLHYNEGTRHSTIHFEGFFACTEFMVHVTGLLGESYLSGPLVAPRHPDTH